MAANEVDAQAATLSNADFTKITGLVEDIFADEDFQILHNDYCSEHCSLFTVGKEEVSSSELEKRSKERFSSFRNYSVQMASYLENELKRSLGSDYEIREFLHEVESRTARAESRAAKEAAASSVKSGSCPNSPRRSECEERDSSDSMDVELIGIDGEIFDMLLTLRDFARFQELMVDYSKMMEGQTNMDGLVSLRKVSDDETDPV